MPIGFNFDLWIGRHLSVEPILGMDNRVLGYPHVGLVIRKLEGPSSLSFDQLNPLRDPFKRDFGLGAMIPFGH
jgi:hypothetical protein